MASLYFLKPIKASKVSIRERERERSAQITRELSNSSAPMARGSFMIWYYF
ncbi:unnamed protein product [Brassica rapa subsp. trilocularis]